MFLNVICGDSCMAGLRSVLDVIHHIDRPDAPVDLDQHRPRGPSYGKY
jgi:hypothetical protein